MIISSEQRKEKFAPGKKMKNKMYTSFFYREVDIGEVH